ncbi:unnamed protein product, partial [Ectocarpus sp. 8 AP-2014]
TTERVPCRIIILFSKVLCRTKRQGSRVQFSQLARNGKGQARPQGWIGIQVQEERESCYHHRGTAPREKQKKKKKHEKKLTRSDTKTRKARIITKSTRPHPDPTRRENNNNEQ